MAGLLNGVVGNLVGAGIQVVAGGIPISESGEKALELLRDGGLPVPPKSWFTPKLTEQQKAQQAYENLGMHVNGALQVLGPCMEIKRLLDGSGGGSAGRVMPAPAPRVPVHYYTPQKPHCQQICSYSKPTSTRNTKNSLCPPKYKLSSNESKSSGYSSKESSRGSPPVCRVKSSPRVRRDIDTRATRDSASYGNTKPHGKASQCDREGSSSKAKSKGSSRESGSSSKVSSATKSEELKKKYRIRD